MPAIAAGAEMTSGNFLALGTWVCATDRALGAEAGVPAMYGLLAPLPAEAMVRMPANLVARSTAMDRSSL